MVAKQAYVEIKAILLKINLTKLQRYKSTFYKNILKNNTNRVSCMDPYNRGKINHFYCCLRIMKSFISWVFINIYLCKDSL